MSVLHSIFAKLPIITRSFVYCLLEDLIISFICTFGRKVRALFLQIRWQNLLSFWIWLDYLCHLWLISISACRKTSNIQAYCGRQSSRIHNLLRLIRGLVSHEIGCSYLVITRLHRQIFCFESFWKCSFLWILLSVATIQADF